MKKMIALMLAMLFAVCAFATTAFADETTTVKADETTTVKTETTTNDDKNDGFDETTTAKADETTTKADETTTKADETTTKKDETTTVADVTATQKPGETAYEGQDKEDPAGATTTKKPASVDTTIPSTGSGIVVPAIALAVLAAGTVAVIKTKKED